MDDIRKIINKLYWSCLNKQALDAAFDDFSRLFPSVNFQFQSQNLNNDNYFYVRSYNYGDSFLTDFNAVKHLNPYPPHLSRSCMDDLIDGGRLLARSELVKTDFYHLFFKPYGLDQSLAVAAHIGDRSAAFLAANVPERYPDDDELILRRNLLMLLPHLQNSFKLSIACHDRTHGNVDDFGNLDALSVPALIVDDELKLFAINRFAEDYFAENEIILKQVNGYLTTSTPSIDLAIQKLIRCALQHGMPLGPYRIALNHTRRIVIFAFPLIRTNGIPGYITPFLSSSRRCLITAIASSQVRTNRSTLNLLFQMTNRELDLVVKLIAGQSLKEAALELGISYITARNHLSNVTRRNEMRSQSDLVRQVTQALAQVPAHFRQKS